VERTGNDALQEPPSRNKERDGDEKGRAVAVNVRRASVTIIRTFSAGEQASSPKPLGGL